MKFISFYTKQNVRIYMNLEDLVLHSPFGKGKNEELFHVRNRMTDLMFEVEPETMEGLERLIKNYLVDNDDEI